MAATGFDPCPWTGPLRSTSGCLQLDPRSPLQQAGRIEQTTTLLAHHDGESTHDLALLGYLYLPDLRTRPDALAKHLYRGGAV